MVPTELYRIATGLKTSEGRDIAPNDIMEYASAFIPRFRAYVATHYWNGRADEVLVIEVAAVPDGEYTRRFAGTLARAFSQECVSFEALTLRAFSFETPRGIAIPMGVA